MSIYTVQLLRRHRHFWIVFYKWYIFFGPVKWRCHWNLRTNCLELHTQYYPSADRTACPPLPPLYLWPDFLHAGCCCCVGGVGPHPRYTVLVKSREMTGRTETLPVVAERRRGKDDRKQKNIGPFGKGWEKAEEGDGETQRELSPASHAWFWSWRLVTYIYYITAAGNVIISQLSSSWQSKRYSQAGQAVRIVHHSTNHTCRAIIC